MDFRVELSLPRLKALTVEQAEACVFDRNRIGQVVRAERLNQPILHSRHGDFPSAELVLELRPHFGRLEQCEAVAVRRVANHDVTALFSELLGESLNLIHAIRFMIYWHDERECRSHRSQDGGQVNFGEIINEQVGGSGAAIHNDQIRLFQRPEDAIEFTPVVQVEKMRVWVEALQRRVLVVGVNGDVRDALVLEELDEVDGEEAFADTTLAVENENEALHVF